MKTYKLGNKEYQLSVCSNGRAELVSIYQYHEFGDFVHKRIDIECGDRDVFDAVDEFVERYNNPKISDYFPEASPPVDAKQMLAEKEQILFHYNILMSRRSYTKPVDVAHEVAKKEKLLKHYQSLC